jgi:ribosome-associated protein
MTKIKIPFSELSFTFSRGSGPGGQNVNKVNSRVTLHWPYLSTAACTPAVLERFKKKFQRFVVDDEIQITCQEHRTQKANQQECITKLHTMLDAVATPPKVRKPTRPKRSAVLKRLDSKKKEGEKKRLRRGDF